MHSLSVQKTINTTRTSSFARSATCTSPSFTYVSNPTPDSSLCRAAAPRLRPLQLLLPDCQLLLPDCVQFNCCSTIVSSHAISMRPPQLLLPDHVRFNSCVVPDSASYCSQVVSISNPSHSGSFTPGLHLLPASSCSGFSAEDGVCWSSLARRWCVGLSALLLRYPLPLPNCLQWRAIELKSLARK